MLPMPSGAVVAFLDTEGFSASDRTADYDAKIFAISALLSSHLLYNSVRIIDTASIECVCHIAPHSLPKTKSHPHRPGGLVSHVAMAVATAAVSQVPGAAGTARAAVPGQSGVRGGRAAHRAGPHSTTGVPTAHVGGGELLPRHGAR